ncbi:MAG: thiol:disulfide interchange protein [Proteobacteria bacterium]|nr:MAG: thiol:disulfide interchange protein [Pseudomonadota bacterium]
MSEPEIAPADAADAGDAGPLGIVRATWRRLRSRWYLRWAIDLLIVVLIFWAFGRWQSRHLLDDGVEAPAFTLRDLDGVERSLSDYRGKVVVLFFWAPWCTVCHLESDNWARIQSWRSDVQVLAIASAFEDVASVEAFVGDDRGAYPVLLGTAELSRAYKVDAFPTHYIIDPDGKIAWQGTGYTPTVALWFRLL